MIQPSARVYVQVRETGEIIELEDFVSLEVTNSIDNDSSCSLRIINKADKWYNTRSRSDRKGTDISQFLTEAYRKPLFRDIARELADKYQQAIKNNNNDLLLDIATLEEYLIFDMMYRVWIDFRGRDNLYGLELSDSNKFTKERWYSGFTGIIGSVSESYTPGKEPSISVNASNMMMLLKNTAIVTDKGFKPTMITGADVLSSYSAYTNNFANFLDGAAIIAFALQAAESTFHSPKGSIYPGSRFWNVPDIDRVLYTNGRITTLSDAEKNGIDRSQQQGGTFGVEWQNKVLKREYEGFLHSREPGGMLALYRDPNYLDNLAFKDLYDANALGVKKKDLLKIITPDRLGMGDPTSMSDPTDATVVPYMISKFAVDRMIKTDSGSGNISTNPYQMMIKGTFDSETQRISGDYLLRAVGDVMNYDVFFDTAGNLIYQKKRFDDFPAANPEIDYDDASDDNRGHAFIDGDGKMSEPLFQKLGKGRYDQSYGLRFHGRNYLIGDESLLGWSINRNERGVVTHVVVPQSVNYMPISQKDLNIMNALGTVSHPELERRFGTRIRNFPPILTNNLQKSLSEVVAEGLVRRANGGLETCNVDLNTRPDLQLGRTMYLMERRRLYYISEISHRIAWGQEFKTTVKGMYGHHPLSPIGDPWQLVLFGDKFIGMDISAQIAANMKLQAARTDGDKKITPVVDH